MADDIVYRFESLAQDVDGTVTPFVLQVARPRFDPARGYYCEIYCRTLRKKPHKIFGENEAQACELTIWFVRRRLVDLGITIIDADGTEIPLPEIDYVSDAPNPEA